MLKNLIIVVVCFSFCLASSAFANPDGIVVRTGGLRIAESGGGLVFPDGSVQYSATLQGPFGPQGVTGPAGPLGPQGVTGPAGPLTVPG